MKLQLKIKPREKKTLIAGGLIAAAIMAYQLFVWYGEFRHTVREYSDASRMKLEKQLDKISGRDLLAKKLESAETQLKQIEAGLITGDTPPVAAAEIQRALKEMAGSLSIEIKSERALNPVEAGGYVGIPVEIGFIAPTSKLKSMLYRISASQSLFVVSEINVRVININKPMESYTTMVVSGFIKKPSGSGEQKAGDKTKNKTAQAGAYSVS
jgi:type II secretory pathway component PulM